MSSVIFSTLGQAVAGPLGGATAALAGSALDAALAGRGRRHKPPEFRAPTSAYGDVVPEIYGVSRVAGVLIWALPFTRTGATKGGTSDRSAFTASFAIALSARPIRQVGRIWADGRLIRNADGEFGLACTMRTYRGVPEQGVDPLLAAAEGIAACPAYRQLAYVVFEEFPLASFGNRIPALSFEVHADSDALPSAWLRDHLLRTGLGGVRCEADSLLRGYAALGPSALEDAEALSAFLGVRPSVDATGAKVVRLGQVWTIPAHELGARRPMEEAANGPRPTTAALAERVSSASVAYLDPERDYLRGTQQFGACTGTRILEVSGPFTATAAEARQSARTLYHDATAAVDRLELSLSWEWMAIAPNDLLHVAADARAWRVVEKLVESGLVRLKCEAVADDLAIAVATEPGRLLPAPIDRRVPTRMTVLEPPVGWSAEDPPALSVFALAKEGWASAAVGWAVVGEGQFAPLGQLRAGMAHGRLAEPLPSGPATVWDEHNRVSLLVEAGEDQLLSRAMQAVLDGANLLRVEDELIQFRLAQQDGANRVLLSGLLRGRLATAPRAHAANASWHLVLPWAAVSLRVQPDWALRALQFEAAGAGDPAEGTRIIHVVSGVSTAPLAPCHLRLARTGSGGLRLLWTARDRSLVDWNSAGMAPPRWYRAQLRWHGGSLPQPLVLRAFGNEVALPDPAVAELQSLGADRLWCEVVAEGEGPLAIRSSGERQLIF
ncbi:GTA baseplate fiber-binding domain-containing protein [Thermaurantiacus sp.]